MRLKRKHIFVKLIIYLFKVKFYNESPNPVPRIKNKNSQNFPKRTYSDLLPLRFKNKFKVPGTQTYAEMQ